MAIPRQEHERTTTDYESRLTRFGESLREQFRQLMQRLTRRAVVPQPRTRRVRKEGESIRGGFRLAAINLMRRAVSVAHMQPGIWDTLTWLRHWEFHGSSPARQEHYQDFMSPGAQESSDLYPHP